MRRTIKYVIKKLALCKY